VAADCVPDDAETGTEAEQVQFSTGFLCEAKQLLAVLSDKHDVVLGFVETQ
jgi:hypothetical protein